MTCSSFVWYCFGGWARFALGFAMLLAFATFISCRVVILVYVGLLGCETFGFPVCYTGSMHFVGCRFVC